MPSMTHRERVIAALSHEIPDRCPMQVSFVPEFARRLRQELSLEDSAGHNPLGGGNDYALERCLETDMLLTSVGWADNYYLEGGTYTDGWGVTWRAMPYQTKFGPGHYTEMVGHPLADENAIASYRPPDPERPELYSGASRTIREFKDEYWIVGVTVTTIFETAWALRGYEQMLIDLVADPDLADRILEIPFRYHLTAALNLVDRGVDMLWTGDDVGAQNSMLMSPALWRRYLKPRMAEFIATVKRRNPALKLAYHSDGMIEPIIPELIEIGVDILNPVQPASMDPAGLKLRYGRDLCFWGSLDEQQTLPFGTAADVALEVNSRLRTIGRGGGLILGPTHHVQLDTPMENFWAMIGTIRNTPYPRE